MSRFWTAVAAALAACVSSGRAADLPIQSPFTKAPIETVTMSWTGPYTGVSLGGRWSDVDWTTSGTANLAGVIVPGQVSADNVQGFDTSSLRVGGYAGYNWQLASRWVVGVEGDVGWARDGQTHGGIPGTGILGAGPGRIFTDASRVRLDWDASVRARAGYLLTPAWLLYGTAGVAFQDVEVSASCIAAAPSWCLTPHSQGFSAVGVGWTVGAGAEWMLSPSWLARGEYRYADFGTFNNTFFAGTPDAVATGVAVRTHTVSAGLAYKW